MGNLQKHKEANFIVVPLKKKITARNAEEILLKLIGQHKLSRKTYDSLVSQTYFKGDLIFQKK